MFLPLPLPPDPLPMSATALPQVVHTLADVVALDHAARRHALPLADGHMVWRCWGQGEPVVLLHGGSGSWTHWVRTIAPLVAAGRQVWVPDLPGFGESAAVVPGGGDADRLPEPMQAALTALLGDAPVDVVGFSFGTMVGALLAERWPRRVRRLVLTGAPALGVRGPNPIELRPWAPLPEGPERDAALRENLAILMLAHPDPEDRLALELHRANLVRDRMRLRRLARTDIMQRTLPRVACPLFGIWGDEDVLHRGVQAQLAPALAIAPDFRGLVRIPGAGHWAQYEKAEAYVMALAAALGQTLP
jgi:2-hydroxy-6-oxonona-2,4-dienedioate hydrolase